MGYAPQGNYTCSGAEVIDHGLCPGPVEVRGQFEGSTTTKATTDSPVAPISGSAVEVARAVENETGNPIRLSVSVGPIPEAMQYSFSPCSASVFR